MANEEQTNQNDAQVQQAVDAALAEQKKKKKRWIIIAVVVVIILIIAVASSSGGDSSDDSTGETQTVQADGSESETEQTEEKIEAGYSVTTDSLKISYVSCDADFKDYNTYATVGSGNKVIRAEFQFENISSTDQVLPSVECYADGSKCDAFYSVDDYASPTLETVSSGRNFTAVIYYEVPSDAQEIELEMDDSYWSSSKTIFVVK